jgi:hypothetical protein
MFACVLTYVNASEVFASNKWLLRNGVKSGAVFTAYIEKD